MRRRATLLLIFLILPASGSALAEEEGPTFGRNVAGRVGIGVVAPEVPIGVRYCGTRRWGFEAGLGFVARTGADDLTRIILDGGGLIALAPGDRVNFYARPGARFTSENLNGKTTTTVQLNAAFSFEYFPFRDFSLTASTGLAVDFVSPPDSPDRTSFFVVGDTVTRVGFFFYLPRSKDRP